MINLIVNNTFDVFDSFATTSLCNHLYENYKKCNPYSLVSARRAKGKLLNDLNHHVCLSGLSILNASSNASGNIFDITNFVAENTPFTIHFGTSGYGNYYHNLSIQTPDLLFSYPAYTLCDEYYSFTYIYTKPINSSYYDFVLIDINNEITTSSIDPYYNTPNAFLNYCSHRGFETHRDTSQKYFYRDFKALLSNSDSFYNTSAYPSENVYCLLDDKANGIFLFTLLPGHRTTHYVILDYRVLSFPVPIVKVTPTTPDHYFYDYPKQDF